MAAGGHGAHELVMAPGLPEALALMNLLILGAVIYFAGRKGIAQFFSVRAAAIKERLEKSKKDLEEIEAKVADTENKLRNFEGLKRKMLEDTKREATALAEKIVADAEKSAKQLLQEARMAADQESRDAINSIREKLIEEALRNVREQLARDPAMREKMHEALIETFATQIQGAH